MRYPPDQKARAKQAILQAGARALRTSGFKGIGVDGLAASAGVMSGAFDSNFSNKEALLEEVIETCLGEPFIDSESGSLAERQDRLKEWLAMCSVMSQPWQQPQNSTTNRDWRDQDKAPASGHRARGRFLSRHSTE